MRLLQLLSKNIPCFILVALSLNCASGNKYNKIGLVPRYNGAGTLSLTDSTLINSLEYQFRTFNDTISKDTISYLWNTYRKQLSESSFPDSTEAQILNLQVMIAILKTGGYNVATIRPCTYESIYALSKLPLLTWTLIILHPGKKSKFITEKDLTLKKTAILSLYANDIQLHLISMIDKKEKIYKIRMLDGVVLKGVANDNLNAQVLPGGEDTDSKYLQVVDCFIVTLLPILELNEHIDEWYSSIPYEHKKPEIHEIIFY